MTREKAKEELIQSLTDNHIPDPEADDNNRVYKENITIKADKHIKGYSNNYPLLCDLEVIFSNNKEWITLRDNHDNSITVEIKSLIKLLGYGKTIGDMS